MLFRSAIVGADAPPRQRVGDLVRHALGLIAERPAWVLTYQNEFLRLVGQPGFEFVAEQSAAIEAAWVRALSESADAGDFAVDVPVDVRYRLVRDATWTAVRWYRADEAADAAALAEHYLAVFYGTHLGVPPTSAPSRAAFRADPARRRSDDVLVRPSSDADAARSDAKRRAAGGDVGDTP